MPLSSPDPRRLVNFLGFAGFAVYFLANDFLRNLREISPQGRPPRARSKSTIACVRLVAVDRPCVLDVFVLVEAIAGELIQVSCPSHSALTRMAASPKCYEHDLPVQG